MYMETVTRRASAARRSPRGGRAGTLTVLGRVVRDAPHAGAWRLGRVPRDPHVGGLVAVGCVVREAPAPTARALGRVVREVPGGRAA